MSQFKIYPKWLLHSVISIQGLLLAIQMYQAYITEKSYFFLVSDLLSPYAK